MFVLLSKLQTRNKSLNESAVLQCNLPRHCTANSIHRATMFSEISSSMNNQTSVIIAVGKKALRYYANLPSRGFTTAQKLCCSLFVQFFLSSFFFIFPPARQKYLLGSRKVTSLPSFVPEGLTLPTFDSLDFLALHGIQPIDGSAQSSRMIHRFSCCAYCQLDRSKTTCQDTFFSPSAIFFPITRFADLKHLFNARALLGHGTKPNTRYE